MLDPDVEAVLEQVRRTMTAIKARTHATGDIYLLAQSLVLMTDLLEHLFDRSHQHVGSGE